MTPARTCPQCDKPLTGDAPQGLCPECLLKAAFPSESALESAATGSFDPSPATTIPPDAGARLKYFGDYELLEEIARGGMGVVWKARQLNLHRDVALKMIRAGALATPDEVARFLREAEAAANLQHPNIVAIHEVGEHDGQHYFSMDLVSGRDLAALITDGPLPPQRAARYVKIIAEAIHFAHQRGTLHRDLKPQNVLIDTADQPRITDFGLAKIMKDDSQLTQSGVVMGSPSYMPPEQAAGRHGDIGPASDVYSLGAMLYELLTGRPPFRGATAMATLHDVMESEPAAPRRLKADIPPDLETICLKCLEKSPAARYPTARALAEELDRFLKGEPIQARPASAVHKAVSWVRRHPSALAAAAAFVMVSLAFGVFYLFEENAFLRAQQADPTLARIPGWRHESLQEWNTINFLAFLAGAWMFFAVGARARGGSFKQRLDTAMYAQPLRPLDERTRNFALGAGLILVGCGVVLLAKTIQAHVWEGESILGPILTIYLVVYIGLAILGIVIRDYRLVHYGTSSRQLTAEQIQPVRRALEGFDLPAAIEHYREAAPEAGWAEARRQVIGLFHSLRAQDPDKFVPPPLSLATLNWKTLGIRALTATVILGVLWYLTPPSSPVSAVSQFAYSFLFGMGWMAFTSVKGFWKRMLLLAPALLVMILSEAIVPRLAESSSHSPGPYLFGFFFGSALMASGFNPLVLEEARSRRRMRGRRRQPLPALDRASLGTPIAAAIEAAFNRDIFFVQHDVLAAAERHRVWDEAGRPILVADSPPRLGRVAFAVPLAAAAFLVVDALLMMLAVAGLSMLHLDRDTGFRVFLGGVVLAFVAAGIPAIAVFLRVLGLRSIVLHADDSTGQPLVELRPTGRSFFAMRYTVYDGKGNCLAGLSANRLYGLWRLRWTGYRPDQSRWFVAIEDSRIPRVVRGAAQSVLGLLAFSILLFAGLVLIVSFGSGHVGAGLLVLLALVAVLGAAGFLIRKLRPNVSIARADNGEILGRLCHEGEETRTRLDLVADQEHFDRRVAVAVAVLMDKL